MSGDFPVPSSFNQGTIRPPETIVFPTFKRRSEHHCAMRCELLGLCSVQEDAADPLAAPWYSVSGRPGGGHGNHRVLGM
jgi:hypothetical protein